MILKTLKFTVIPTYCYLVYCVCHKGTISSHAMLWIFLSPEIPTLLKAGFPFPSYSHFFHHRLNEVVLETSCCGNYPMTNSTSDDLLNFFNISCMYNDKHPVILTSCAVTSVAVKCIDSQWEDSGKKNCA